MKNLKGTFILLLAAFIWGTAFVAQTSAGDNIERLHLMPVGILSGHYFYLLLLQY